MNVEAAFLIPIGAAAATAAAHGGPIWENFIGIGAVVGIVAGAAGAIYTAKNRAELGAARGAAEAWKEERDAALARADRIETNLREEASARRAAEARTDITALATQVAANHKATIDVLSRITAAVERLAEQ